MPNPLFINLFHDQLQQIGFTAFKIKLTKTHLDRGLGLPIAQHYAALLGGELEFESTPEKGSKFWFSLPFTNGKGFLSIVN